MAEKKRKLTDGWVGEQSENPPKSVSNAPMDTSVLPMAKEGPINVGVNKTAGGRKLFGQSDTQSLERATLENKTSVMADEIAKKMSEAAIERAKKRNAKP